MQLQFAQALHSFGNGTHLLVHGPGTPGQRCTLTQPALDNHAFGGAAPSQADELVDGVAITVLEVV